MRLVTLTALPVTFAVLLCAAPARAQEYGEAQAAPPVFEFHSGFWINLHHFLYVEGRLRNAAGESRAGIAQSGGSLKAASTDGFSAEEKQNWNAAVDAYAADWSARDLQLNGDMAIVNNRLAELENCSELSGKIGPACEAGLRPGLVVALNQAAGVYRAHLWTEQDRVSAKCLEGDMAQMVGYATSAQAEPKAKRGWFRRRT